MRHPFGPVFGTKCSQNNLPIKRYAALCILKIVLFFAALSVSTNVFAQSPGPTPSVTVRTIKLEDVSQTNEFVGRVEAVQSVELRARVDGFLFEQRFEEGADVQADQLLFVIEPDEYEARRDASRAQVAKELARYKEAELTLKRRQTLLRRDNTSQASVDEAEQQRDATRADLQAARANLRQAELELSYTKIHAPIAGRIGRAAFTKGNLVGPESGSLARVNQLNPIRVVFSVPDRQLLQAISELNPTSPDDLNSRFLPTLVLGNGDMYQHQGEIEFADNQIDSQTGTLAVRALFPNPNNLLLPGQLVRVRSRRKESEMLPIVPVASIQSDRMGSFVLLIDAQNRVETRRIGLGSPVESGVAVTEGLQGGETVIVQGIQKVRTGQTVNPVRAESPMGGG
ncbi:MAG: efflux RND transporter periplasmic adaptor subunit [Pseudomonadota bacterium]